MKSIRFASVFLLLILTMSCARRSGKGPHNIVYILASEKVKQNLQTTIDTTFSYGMRTPAFEHYFITSWFPMRSINQFISYRNLIVISDITEPGVGRDFAKKVLPEDQYALAEKDSNCIFGQEDYWVDDQVFIMVAGSDYEKMKQCILSQKGWIFGKFEKKFKERQKEFLYHREEQKKVTKNLWAKYRWTFRLQHDWIKIQEYPEKNFIWFGRGFPHRWLSFSWEKGVMTEWLTPNGLFEHRNEIGDIYSEIETDTRFLGHRYTDFGGYKALRMSGLWYHEKETKGGPFVTYAFYDSKSDRTFVIDILMFEPSSSISIPFRQVEVMAETFTTSFSEDIFN